MSCVVADTFELTPDHPQFQPLGVAADAVVADLTARRIAWMIARHGVAEPMARALAELAFERQWRRNERPSQALSATPACCALDYLC